MTTNSARVSPTLHIEWSPSSARAFDTATNEHAEAASISGLGTILNGHRQAIVGVGHSAVFLKTLRLPKAEPEDLRAMLDVQLGTLFPLPADRLSFDFLQTDDQTPDGWLTIVAAMRAEQLGALRDELRQAGITPVRVLPVALAAASVAARAGASVEGALVIDQQRAGLTIDVVQSGALRVSRIAPLGADAQTEIARTRAAARLNGLPVVTSGGAAQIAGALHGRDSELCLLNEAPPLNFELSEDRLRETKKRIHTRTRLGVLMIFAALLLMLLVWADRQDALAVVKRSQGRWARELTTYQSILSTENARVGRIVAVQASVQQAFAPGQPLSDIAAVVSDSLPKGAWITSLTLERGKPLEVRGSAETAGDITKLVDALGSNERFRDVRLVFANSATIGATSVVQFNVTATCVGNLPMPAPLRTRTRTATTNSTSSAPGGGK